MSDKRVPFVQVNTIGAGTKSLKLLNLGAATAFESHAVHQKTLGASGSNIKVEMVMPATPWIQLRAAHWAPILTGQVIVDGQLRSATTAEDRLFGPLVLWPDLNRMVG